MLHKWGGAYPINAYQCPCPMKFKIFEISNTKAYIKYIAEIKIYNDIIHFLHIQKIIALHRFDKKCSPAPGLFIINQSDIL